MVLPLLPELLELDVELERELREWLPPLLSLLERELDDDSEPARPRRR